MDLVDVFPDVDAEFQSLFSISNESDAWLRAVDKVTYTRSKRALVRNIENTINIMSNLIDASNSKIIEHTEPALKESYWILPDGKMILCECSRHNAVALLWFMHNDMESFNYVLVNNNIDFARSQALIRLGWVEFSVQENEMNIVTSEWYENLDGATKKEITNKQKESLAKILEVNNLKDEKYWKYVY